MGDYRPARNHWNLRSGLMKTLVRGTDGKPLTCCWDDCERHGDDRVKVVVNDKDARIHYIFCSVGHRDFWLHRNVSYGNRPAGARTPAGLILPAGRG